MILFISETEWSEFVNHNKVSLERIKIIAEKYRKGIILNQKEKAIFVANTNKIEEYLKTLSL